jgi:hypothetical protein
MIHGFFTMANVLDKGEKASAEAAMTLKKAFVSGGRSRRAIRGDALNHQANALATGSHCHDRSVFISSTVAQFLRSCFKFRYPAN